jgi:flagella basal body P-ring formation protein FlgA
MVLLSLAAAAAVSAASAPGGVETIEIEGSELRLGDLTALRGFAAAVRGQDGARVIAALPAGRSSVVVTRGALAELVGRSPAAVRLELEAPEQRIVIRRAAEASRRCFAAARAIVAGERISAADLVPADCRPAAEVASLRLDRADGSVRAGADIAVGDYVGRVAPAQGAEVPAGSALSLVSRVGPVTIRRPVVALQPGRAGGNVFVRDGDGQVFSVRVGEQP